MRYACLPISPSFCKAALGIWSVIACHQGHITFLAGAKLHSKGQQAQFYLQLLTISPPASPLWFLLLLCRKVTWQSNQDTLPSQKDTNNVSGGPPETQGRHWAVGADTAESCLLLTILSMASNKHQKPTFSLFFFPMLEMFQMYKEEKTAQLACILAGVWFGYSVNYI